VTHSARKGSAALCALSTVVTAALAMLRGKQWAFAAGLVLWTLEKAFAIVNSPSSSAPVAQIMWWAIYMHSFLLAYKVESARTERARTQITQAPAPCSRRLR
jgi:hypothetical protein